MTATPMPTTASPRRKGKTQAASDGAERVELSYTLAELPSAQHRAGLAGLLWLIDWLRQQGSVRGVCQIVSRERSRAALLFDREGLRCLFDELYAASAELKPEPKQRKDKKGDLIAPVKTETREKTETDKTGKSKTKSETLYFYPTVIPRVRFLIDLDPQKSEDSLWVKLWRDMLWSILRGVPATRAPYEERAAGEASQDAEDVFDSLLRPPTHALDLSSTLYLGAQACTAENVSFRDRARYQLLLHFWPLIAQIYCPYVLDAQKGEREFVGYAIAIPDVADLPRFLRAWENMMHDRLPNKVAYRPQGAVIDVAVESALDLAGRLHQSIATLEGEKGTRPAILGVEVLHMNKEGNNVRLLSSDRLDPTFGQLREYEQIKRACWDVVFRRQRLLNLIKNRPWYFGFDGLAATLPYKSQFFGSARFRRDAFSHFEQLRKEMNEQEHAAASGSASGEAQDELSVAVYRLARSYVRRKVKSKYGLDWKDSFRNPESLTPEDRRARDAYADKQEKVASEAFLAVRGRTGADFAEYFCASLCSVPQAISEANFQRIGRALRDKESQAELRILTLLALSAAAYTSLDKKSDSRPAADSNS